ncbi:MAG TPA: Wzz/FepE/Etk N-terminal domain-containing protein [Candidatus Limnocylindrales bacterium]|nr:Wzz/FepE/Etk N-terminal domain-containing protein [Candidatus Limnocylindrales bacterium]
MDLRPLFRVLRARWWLVVPTFLIAFGSSIVFTLSQPPIYEATATFEVRSAPGFQEDVLTVISLVSRQQEIATTYATIAGMRFMRREVADRLGLTGDDRTAVEVEARLIPGTLIIELAARSRRPELARDYCNELGRALAEYVGAQSAVFELGPLDQAGLPDRPVAPNVPLNLGIGLLAALVLSLGVGYASYVLRPPQRSAPTESIVDEESGAYGESFLRLRLEQEVSRARRTGAPVSVAIVDANDGGALDELSREARAEALRTYAGTLAARLPAEGLVAHLGGGRYGILLPDVGEPEAVQVVEALRLALAAPTGSGSAARGVRPVPAGVVTYVGGEVSSEDLLAAARRALREASTTPAGRVVAVSAGHGAAARGGTAGIGSLAPRTPPSSR